MTDIKERYFDDIQPLFTGLEQTFSMEYDHSWPDSFSLQFLYRGSILFGRDGKGMSILRAPSLYWIEPEHTYQLAGVDGEDKRHYVLFRGARAERLMKLGFNRLSHEGHIRVQRHGQMEGLFRDAIRFMSSGRQEDADQACVCFERILLLSQQDAHPPRPVDSVIDKIADMISESPECEYDFRKLARDHHMSYSLFRQRFRQLVGRPPHDYLLFSRMQLAAQLLHDHSKQVKEIAFELGYRDAAQFCKIFRRQIGMTPRQYRHLA